MLMPPLVWSEAVLDTRRLGRQSRPALCPFPSFAHGKARLQFSTTCSRGVARVFELSLKLHNRVKFELLRTIERVFHAVFKITTLSITIFFILEKAVLCFLA